jgi:hypothetical protein
MAGSARASRGQADAGVVGTTGAWPKKVMLRLSQTAMRRAGEFGKGMVAATEVGMRLILAWQSLRK